MNAVVERVPESQAVAEANPMKMLQMAVAQGWDTDRLQKLMDLSDRWEKNNARKAFVSAMAGFKSEPTRILKSKKVDIPGGAKFSHATLADVCDGVVANLSKYGLSHKWELKQDGNRIEVTCIVTHEAGHFERTTLEALPDDSGKKNSIQQIASTVSYLERYTLLAATGLSAKDMDDDARSAVTAASKEPVPEGYENWKADMTAAADEGSAKLQDAWSKSHADLRRYVIKFDEAWWADSKRKAHKASALVAA
jgi:ERF superfamily